MKNILIISEYFAPENIIAAIRPTKLAKYLKKTGKYHITVLTTIKTSKTRDSILENDLQFVDDLINVNGTNIVGNFIQKIIAFKRTHFKPNVKPLISCSTADENLLDKKNNKLSIINIGKIIQEMNLFIVFISNYLNGTCYIKNAKKYLKRNKDQKFDFIFSTYGPLTPHYIARYAKKLNPRAFWVTDFRDAVFNEFVPLVFRHYCKNYPNKICKKSDVITAVSQGVMDGLSLNKNTKKMIICNGFDRDDIQKLKKSESDGKFTLSYTGTLYAGKRDLGILFKALRELIDENIIQEEKLSIHYAGGDENFFYSQIEPYHLENVTVFHGKLERKVAMQLQVDSDILLLASWNTKESTGIITGKFLEYMMMDKPVISIITGEIPNSKVKQITCACKLGFCFEQANSEGDYALLKQYLEKKYNEFIKYGAVKHEPNKEEIEKYSYERIIQNLNQYYRHNGR